MLAGDFPESGESCLAEIETITSSPTVTEVSAEHISTNSIHDAEIATTLQTIETPSVFDERMSITVTIEGTTQTLLLEQYSLRSENFRVLEQAEDGSLTELEVGPDKTYRGTIAEHPELLVSAVFVSGGVHAVATDNATGEVIWRLSPVSEAPTGVHRVTVSNSRNPGDSAPVAIGIHAPVVETTSSLAATPVEPLSQQPASNIAFGTSDGVVLNPISVKRAEIAFDVSNSAYVNRYGSSTQQVMDQINLFLSSTLEGRLNTIWIRDALVEHQLGQVIVRTSAAADPYIQAGHGNRSGTDGVLLNAFRDHWNSGVHGTSHDLAHLMLGAGGGGLAWVGSVGGSLRYSMADGGDKNSWLGFARHEVGHTWGLQHSHGGVNFNQPNGTTGEPTGTQYGIMWGGNHGAMTPLEQQTVFNLRNGVAGQLDDVGALTSVNIRPYGKLDSFTVSESGTFALDLLSNDHDANNDPLYISGVGQRFTAFHTMPTGSTLEISKGTGPSGQDMLLYTPAPGVSQETVFYRVNDGQLDNFGQVNLSVTLPVDAAYQFDFGIYANPAYSGINAPGNLPVGNANWNLVTKDNATLTNVYDAEGQVSPVGLKIREANDGAEFDFSAPAEGLEGRDANYGGFYGTDLLSNLMFTRDNDDLGIQVTNLPSGIYSVNAILREPSAADRTYSIDIGAGVGDTATFGDFGLGHTTATPGSAPESWVESQNYYRETVSLYQGESLFVLIDSTDSEFVSLQGLQLAKIGDVSPPPRNVYQIDFGPTDNGVQTGIAGPAQTPSRYVTWNAYTNITNELNNIVDGTGVATPGLTVKVRETADRQVFDFDAPVSGVEQRDANYSGFYGIDLLSDLFFSRSGDDLGVQISGLTPGEYDIFLIARETDSGAGTGSTRTYAVNIGTSTTSSVAFGDLGTTHATATPPSAPESWVEGQNYYRQQVTVESGEFLYVLVDSTNSEFSLLQGLQIVQLTAPPALPGDYNGDGGVDSADYTVWRDSIQSSVLRYTGADGNGDGSVNELDFAIWNNNFGLSVPGATQVAAHEQPVEDPPSNGLSLTGLLQSQQVSRQLPLQSPQLFTDSAFAQLQWNQSLIAVPALASQSADLIGDSPIDFPIEADTNDSERASRVFLGTAFDDEIL